MRQIIRSAKTHEYFQKGQWIADPAQAETFPDAGKLIDTCLRYQLRDVELILQADEEAKGNCGLHFRLFDYAPCGSTGME